ncbi:MAG: aldose epimerase family protein [Bryobacteraceae bacterium]
MSQKDFGRTADNQAVTLYTLTNAKGMNASIMNYGGVVVSLYAPDRSGKLDDVVLGFDSLAGYLKENPYFGALIGRYGNRIAKGRFRLNRTEYKLAVNNGPNHLHGGIKGFDKVLWAASNISAGSPALELAYTSKDGEEGYPGNLTVKVVYTLTEDNGLKIDYHAITDKDTVLNLTNHSYFNLAGASGASIANHKIRINADRFTPVDSGLIPTGELKPVEGTPFDFRTAAAIGSRIDADDTQIKYGKGYDHNFVLNRASTGLSLAARVSEPTSGRVMEVHTTEPGVQFYTGNFLDGSLVGKAGKAYQNRYALCLETQHFPNSPNEPKFPSTVLKPESEFRSTTIYRFSSE